MSAKFPQLTIETREMWKETDFITRVLSAFIASMFSVLALASSEATAATVGSNLSTPANDSVCAFQSLEPETRVCNIGQRDLLTSHTTTEGLLPPFNGVIVRWSVLSGIAPPGTGEVKLALRTMNGAPSYREREPEVGPEVVVPSSPPGTRHTFAAKMPIWAGQPFGLKISVANRSTQEAGVPIAFREEGIGMIDTWSREPGESIWEPEEDVELLLNVEIEPDADRDGYGDLTQDCFPNRFDEQFRCGGDFLPPRIRPKFKARQAFLRSGVILVRIASNEAGLAWAEGRLEIKGRRDLTYGLRSTRRAVTEKGRVALRLRMRKRVLKVARAAARAGKKIVVMGRVGVVDSAGNERQVPVRIRPRP